MPIVGSRGYVPGYSVRVTFVRGRLRVVVVASSLSSSSDGRDVRGVREVLDVSESVVVGVVESGLMSLVTGGLVLVIVSVVVGVDDACSEVLENVGST